MPDYRAAILDEASRELPDNVVGRLAVKGPTGCRSPAPPLIALLGLLGMVLGEQAVDMARRHLAPPAWAGETQAPLQVGFIEMISQALAWNARRDGDSWHSWPKSSAPGAPVPRVAPPRAALATG